MKDSTFINLQRVRTVFFTVALVVFICYGVKLIHPYPYDNKSTINDALIKEVPNA